MGAGLTALVIASVSAVSTSTAAIAAPASSPAVQSDADVNKSLDSMAKLFAGAVTDENLRRQIHDGVAKRFDGDTNVLFSTLSNTSEVRAALATEYSRQRRSTHPGAALSAIDRLASDIPGFQVAVPVKFDDWDPASHTPLVAFMPEGVDDTTLKSVTAYDATGKARVLDAQVAPAQPVIVLGVNERTDDSGPLSDSATDSEKSANSAPQAMAGTSYLVEMFTISLQNDNEPWTKGDAELSYRAKSRGCSGVDHTDHNVSGLDHDGNSRTWWDGDGLNLGQTSCPVIFYWWEDDGGSYDFGLSYKGFSLGVHMDDGDDLIGGHEHAATYFKGDSGHWYSGLDDVWYHTE